MADELKLKNFKRVIGSDYFIDFQANEFSTRVLGISTGETNISDNRVSVVPQTKNRPGTEQDVARTQQKTDRIASFTPDISVRSRRILIPLNIDAVSGDKTFERGGRQFKFRNATLLFPEGVNLIVISHIIATACPKVNDIIKLYKGRKLFREAGRTYHPIAEFESAYLNKLVKESHDRYNKRLEDADESTTQAKGKAI